MHSYLIIGCGHFGSRAARQLLGKRPDSKITLVDRDEEVFQKVSDLPVEKIVADAIPCCDRVLLNGSAIEYIIPAVPFHLAFEYVLSHLRPLGAKRTKVPAIEGLPHPMIGATGDLYTSFADFLCPEDCPEPSEACPATGEKRHRPLFEVLEDLKGPFESRVIRSRQLGPGVGGFPPRALVNLLETIEKRMGLNRPFLISTACRCHGVTSALSFETG